MQSPSPFIVAPYVMLQWLTINSPAGRTASRCQNWVPYRNIMVRLDIKQHKLCSNAHMHSTLWNNSIKRGHFELINNYTNKSFTETLSSGDEAVATYQSIVNAHQPYCWDTDTSCYVKM